MTLFPLGWEDSVMLQLRSEFEMQQTQERNVAVADDSRCAIVGLIKVNSFSSLCADLLVSAYHDILICQLTDIYYLER